MNRIDQRRNVRANISNQALFYRETPDGRRIEFEGTIKNISQTGVYFEATTPKAIDVCKDLRQGDKLSFVFVDDYELYGKEHTAVIQDDAYIVRSSTTNEIVKLGCEIKLRSRDIENYIKDKEVTDFLNFHKTSLPF